MYNKRAKWLFRRWINEAREMLVFRESDLLPELYDIELGDSKVRDRCKRYINLCDYKTSMSLNEHTKNSFTPHYQ